MATIEVDSSVDADVAPDAFVEELETQEWLDSLDFVLQSAGPERVSELLKRWKFTRRRQGVKIPFAATTPYINTIPRSQQPQYPGDRELERRIKSIIRWNAMAMVVRANKATDSGRAATRRAYLDLRSRPRCSKSVSTTFSARRNGESSGDQVFFQGHASPGNVFPRFLEGRLSEQNLVNFRQELQPGVGLSSYPHPWLMPDFWQFPTVSMGLGPILLDLSGAF